MRTPKGLRVAGNVIPQQPTLSNMTKSELTFSLLVEEVRGKFYFNKMDFLIFSFPDVKSHSTTRLQAADS